METYHFVLYQLDTPSPFRTYIKSRSNGRCKSGDMNDRSNCKHECGDMKDKSNNKHERGDMKGKSNGKNECGVLKSSTVNFVGNLRVDPMVDKCHSIHGSEKKLDFGTATHSKSHLVNNCRCSLYEL